MAAKVVCISVIDEADSSQQLNNRNTDFNNFRSTYPNRELWLLNPLPAYTSQLGLLVDGIVILLRLVRLLLVEKTQINLFQVLPIGLLLLD